MRRYAGGIESLPALYAALRDGSELQNVGPFPRWNTDSLYSPAGGIGKIASRFGAFVHSTFEFDAEVFGLSVNEASLMDPQQRVLLEETLAAFHAAGKLFTMLASCVAVKLLSAHATVSLGVQGASVLCHLCSVGQHLSTMPSVFVNYSCAAN